MKTSINFPQGLVILGVSRFTRIRLVVNCSFRQEGKSCLGSDSSGVFEAHQIDSWLLIWVNVEIFQWLRVASGVCPHVSLLTWNTHERNQGVEEFTDVVGIVKCWSFSIWSKIASRCKSSRTVNRVKKFSKAFLLAAMIYSPSKRFSARAERQLKKYHF